MGFIAWLKKHVCEDDAWITVHPNASGPGSPVLLDDEGYIKGGMGGKFTGQRIDLMPRKSGYGLPVSENDPLNNSTPGFLRTFRYNLKAPQNVASYATLTEAQKSKISGEQANLESMVRGYQRYYENKLGGEEALNTRLNVAKKNIEDAGAKIEARADLTDDEKSAMLKAFGKMQYVEIYYEAKGFAPKDRNRKIVFDQLKKNLESAINGTLQDNTAPLSLGGALRGAPMTVEQADELNANQSYYREKSARINCQTCVVAYEARLRGYDVEAALRTRNSMSEAVSENWTSPFYDTKTGLPPAKIEVKAANPQKAYDFLKGHMKEGERYILYSAWKTGGAHVQNIELHNGEPRVIDAQTGKIKTGRELLAQLGDAKLRGKFPPEIVRIDNLSFAPDICNTFLLPKAVKK